MIVHLPHLGERLVRLSWFSNEPGHYLWLDAFGWHDCTAGEDSLIQSRLS